MSNATQTNITRTGACLVHNSNSKSKIDQVGAIDGSDLFKQLLSQKMLEVNASDCDDNCAKLENDTVPKAKSVESNNVSDNADNQFNDDILTLKPVNVEFRNNGSVAVADGGVRYSTAAMQSEVIKLQEQIQSSNLICENDGNQYDIEEFFDDMMQSPLIYHVNLAVDNSAVAEMLNTMECATPIEMLSCEVSSYPWIITPNMPLSLSNDWQLHHNSSDGNSIAHVRSGVNSSFLANVDGVNLTDVQLVNAVEHSIIFDEAIRNATMCDRNFTHAISTSTSQDSPITGEMMYVCNTHNISFDYSTDIHGYDNLTKVVGRQLTNAISNVSMHLLRNGGMEVSLHPETLGTVKIVCNVRDKMELHIIAEKASTLTMLQQNANEIKNALLNNINSSINDPIDLHFQQNNSSNMSHRQTAGDGNRNQGTGDSKQVERISSDVVMLFSHNGVINFIIWSFSFELLV